MIKTEKSFSSWFFSLCCAGPATAAINTISQGNAVFIGEEGLDISSAKGRIPGLDGGLRLRIALPFPDKYD